mmetsp:Transcript_22980/g.37985  ORF Transcript_22980/g.37985 Transcript_22980/m.37985 type:complete len:462 (+) Transcript_22980:118-1503(+)
METPKMRRIRRHTSLNARLHQRRPSLGKTGSTVLNKSNPYVGWFRHAPSSASSCSSSRSATSSSLIDDFQKKNKEMQKSPYVGWFRHSPPIRFIIQNRKRIKAFDHDLMTLSIIEERRRTLMKVDGFLRGGVPASWLDRDTIQRTLRDSSAGSASATIQVLSRLATWFLFPLAHDQSSCGYSHEQLFSEKEVIDLFPHVFGTTTARPVESDDDCSTVTDNDENADDQSDDSSIQTIGTHLPLNHDYYNDYTHHPEQGDPPHEFSVSSLAEAYYAHQAAEGFDRSLRPNDGLSEDDGERLDSVITQIDIARMARNASRHLDVESILSLPTITYQDPLLINKTNPTSSSEFGEETGASWLIVPPAEDELQPDINNKDGHVCVICLEHFQQGDRLRALPCSHSFHVGCIDRWLSGSHSFDDCFTSGCPTCKKTPSSTMDGSVPSWAFSRLGETMANGSISSTSS